MGFPLWVYFFGDGSLPSINYLFFSFIIFGVILLLIISNLNLLVGSYNSSTEEVIKSEPSEEKIKDGPFEVFHDSYGSVKLVGHYSNGKKSGVWEYFSEDGILLISGNYKNGVKDGIWKDYWYSEEPTLHFQVTYENGKIIDGPFESYYENGKPFMTGNYNKGRKHGIWKSYHYENGILNHQGTFRNGTLVGNVYTYENNDENHLKTRVEIKNPRYWLVEVFYPPKGLKKPVVKSTFEIYEKKTIGVRSNYDEWGTLIEKSKFSNWIERIKIFDSVTEYHWEYFIEERTFSSDINHNKGGKDFIENFELKSNTLEKE
jgi:antitoxin component YwqK of YwqJK toxin-antitoxin module